MLEIEKKYLVKSHDEYIEILNSLNANLIDRDIETDTYFNVSSRDSMITKECLRTRRKDGYYEVTYKPGTRREELQKSHFSKIETNVELPTGSEIETLLELIGNTRLVTLKKDRTTYRLGALTICLDIINDTTYCIELELEGGQGVSTEDLVKDIDVFAARLNLDEDMIEKRPYRDIAMGL